MRPTQTREALTPARHIAGASLLLFALSSLVFAARLPMRSADSAELRFLDDIEAPVVVGFAGFPGCGDVCPAGMALLGRVAHEMPAPVSDRVSLLFINLQRGTPPQLSAAYAEAFSPAIRSYTSSFADTDELFRGLALRTFDNGDTPVAHSGYFYIFVRDRQQWRIEHVYRRMPPVTDLIERLAHLSANDSERV